MMWCDIIAGALMSILLVDCDIIMDWGNNFKIQSMWRYPFGSFGVLVKVQIS